MEIHQNVILGYGQPRSYATASSWICKKYTKNFVEMDLPCTTI